MARILAIAVLLPVLPAAYLLPSSASASTTTSQTPSLPTPPPSPASTTTPAATPTASPAPFNPALLTQLPEGAPSSSTGPAPALGTEVVAKRTQNSSTFATANPGVFVTKVFPQPINQKDSLGTWVPIDLSLSPSNGRLRTSAAANALDLATSQTDPSLGHLSLDASHSVAFSLSGAKPGTGVATTTTVTYRGILPSTDLSLQSISGGVKEGIILNSASAPTSFLFPLTLQGLAASVTPQGEVAYTDATGTVRAITPQGYMQDSADPLHKVGAVSQGVTYTLVSSGTGGQALQVSLDSAWIRNPARVFPIVVDPTTQDYYTGQDDTYVMSGFTRDNASDTVLKLGTYDGGANVAIDFMNFPSINTSIPTNASISAASLGVYNNWSWSCTPEDVNVYQVTSGWAGHGLQSYPGANLGALLGTQSFADGYSGCANGPNWANFNVASTVQGWVNGSITNDGLAMAVDANQQTNNYAWKTFYSYDTCSGSCGVPQLQVTWSVPPSPPQNVQATPVATPRGRCGSPGRRLPTWALVARSATTSWTCGTAAPTPACTSTTPPAPRSSLV